MKVIAIASGGGHWEELVLMKEAFIEEDVMWVTTLKGLSEIEGFKRQKIVSDTNRKNKIKMVKAFVQIYKIITEENPELIITTGAAPGLFAVIIGKFYKIKTIWIDSIANSTELSLSGRIAKHFANQVYTQHKSLSEKKVKYIGKIF